MVASINEPNEKSINLAEALGANAGTAVQCFTVYIPNKDKFGKEIGNQRKWVLEALDMLTRLNGGATGMPPVEGTWRDEHGNAIWDHPIVVYSFIKPEIFFPALPIVREFLHRMGRATNQGEVAFEFGPEFFLISAYDLP